MTTETKWTPGPWKVLPRGDLTSKFTIPVFATVGDGVVCSIVHTYTAEPRDRANARLIAAAPDLYEALAGLLAQYDLHDPAAEAALARARGEG